MPKVESADHATEIAVGFLKNHFRISQRPVSARRDNGKWVVEVDVGPFFPVVARVAIDPDTGTILEYQVQSSPT